MSTALALDDMLPLSAAVVTLRFVAEARPGFFHQPALSAMVRGLVDSPADFDTLLTLDTAENGRVYYRRGDRYRFVVLALGGAEDYLQLLLERLRALPQSAPRHDGVFGANLAFVEAHDYFDGRKLGTGADLSRYDADRLAAETGFWSAAQDPRVRWLTPARLLLAKDARRERRNESRYCRSTADLPAELLAARLHDGLASLLRRRGGSAPRRSATHGLAPLDGDLFWVNTSYRRKDGTHQPMGGIMGVVDVPVPADDDAWFWRAWVLGQYVGIGQRRAFGWGRYRLETTDGRFNLPVVSPGQGLLERATLPDNLADAHAVIERNRSESPFARNEPKADDDDDDDLTAARLDKLAARLASGSYAVEPLHGVILREPDGGVRALAVPPFLDRVAQRAVAQILVPGLEKLFNQGSFGYRPNRSRQRVAREIERAWNEGFRWVFESDIDDFFDSVGWDHLHNRLRALYRDDPLVDQILKWMAAPVSYRDRTIERHAGLPQGAPLSPLMANLMLDDFDHDLEQQGFRLLRFADDFVVLCRDRDKAAKAALAAAKSLQEIGLELNAGKTRISAFEQGFRYLGYLFVRSLALDVGGQKHAMLEDAAALPPGSWLARLAQRDAAALDPADRSLPTLRRDAEPATAASATPRRLEIGSAATPRATTLFVTGATATLSSRGGRVQVTRADRQIASMPWKQVRAILLLGAHHITTPALRQAMRDRIPVHFATGGGRYHGVSWSGQPAASGAQLWLRQTRFFLDEQHALAAATAVVAARLRHLREHLRQRCAGTTHERNIDALQEPIRQVDRAASLAELNGIEGNATRRYFQTLRDLVPNGFGFRSRERRPPRDPVNALLSFGYTILYCHVESVLRVSGLLPWSGFYHQRHGRHATLASDLMEPFRHLVERTALTAVIREELTPSDFSVDSRGACRIGDTARRRYLAMLVKRFDQPMRAVGSDEPMGLHRHLEAQNRALIDWIDGRAESFAVRRFR